MCSRKRKVQHLSSFTFSICVQGPSPWAGVHRRAQPRAEQWGWHQELSNRVVLLTTLFQRVLNASREKKYLSSFQIFNTAASPFCFVFFSLYLRQERNTGREQSLKSLADVLLPADVLALQGWGIRLWCHQVQSFLVPTLKGVLTNP